VPQLDAGYLDANTTLVLLSIGGNDTGFSDVVKQCLYRDLTLSCPDTKLPGDDLPMSLRLPRLVAGPVHDSIHTVLQQVHVRAPNATVVLIGYPQLFVPVGDGTCIEKLGVTGDEQIWLNAMGDLLTGMQRRLAADVTATEGFTVRFVDPSPAFTGKGVCASTAAINGIVVDLTDGDSGEPSMQSFHPNPIGAGLYAGVLNQTLRELGL
jgi:hypothetical protein